VPVDPRALIAEAVALAGPLLGPSPRWHGAVLRRAGILLARLGDTPAGIAQGLAIGDPDERDTAFDVMAQEHVNRGAPADALAVLATPRPTSNAEHQLSRLAGFLAAAGHLAEARQCIERIPASSSWRDPAVRGAAGAFGDRGRVAEAEALLDLAREPAQVLLEVVRALAAAGDVAGAAQCASRIPASGFAMSAWLELAAAHARRGDLAAALSVADRDPAAGEQVRVRVIDELASRGQLEAARQVFGRLQTDWGPAHVRDRLAGALARHGQQQAALELANGGDAAGRAAATRAIATALADRGELTAASDLARRIKRSGERDLAWSAIADAHRRRGELDLALAANAKIRGKTERGDGLGGAALERCRAGDLPGAVALLEGVGSDGPRPADMRRDNILWELVRDRVDAGDLTGALWLHSRIEGEFLRTLIFPDLGQALGKASDLADALATARTLEPPVLRATALLAIAGAAL
jgi:tetratricopeptide (TPR) repeat protein